MVNFKFRLNVKMTSGRHITYETNRILTDFGGTNFNPQSSREASQYIIDGGKFIEFEKPVSAAAAMETDTGFETGYINLKSIS